VAKVLQADRTLSLTAAWKIVADREGVSVGTVRRVCKRAHERRANQRT
jgi:hypothetical protein